MSSDEQLCACAPLLVPAPPPSALAPPRYFYTLVEYLCRQIDHVLKPSGPMRAHEQRGGKRGDGGAGDGGQTHNQFGRMSKHRRRLLRIRAHPVFHAAFTACALALVALTVL